MTEQPNLDSELLSHEHGKSEQSAKAEYNWATHEALYKRIPQLGNGGLEAYAQRIGILAQIFRNPADLKGKELVIGCMDEGVLDPDLYDGGSFALKSVAEAKASLRKIYQKYNPKKIRLTTHRGCGAATLAHKTANPNDDQNDLMIERFAHEQAQHVALESRKDGVDADHHFVLDQRNELARPSYHIATATYVDFSNSLSKQKLYELNQKGLHSDDPNERGLVFPVGFVLSSDLYEDLDTLANETELSADIAFGQHGFNNKFTPETPFIVTVIESPEGNEFDQIKTKFQSITAKYGNRVVFEKLKAPVVAETKAETAVEENITQ